MTRQEFEQLTVRIRSRLVVMASRFVKDSGICDDADDIVQESLLVLWRQTENGYEMQNPEALAVAITKKVCLAHLRGCRPMVQSIDGVEVAGGVSASDLTDESDMNMVKESLLALLTPTQRQYLYFRNEMGLSLDEIAEVTGSPKTSIKTTISAARRLLLEHIKKDL
ncbi:MAG: RNA polymerase sigma factor [Bacteroidaceae bacterium]|nr:RNA polymerase sigma factor [Bacteroidaceae bacterium]